MSDPVEVLLKRLTAIARGRETPKGLHFFCQYGSSTFNGGVTTLQVSGTGWVLLSHRPRVSPNLEADLYSAYVSTRDLRALARLMVDHPFWELDTARHEVDPEETNIHLRLMDTGRGFAWDTQVWSNERYRQADLRKVLDTVNLIIDMVSDGTVPSL